MSKHIHITSVTIPELSAVAAAALETGGLAEAVAAMAERVTVIITFGDGSIYRYPNVPTVTALALKTDPEGTFPAVRYWPGYERVQ